MPPIKFIQTLSFSCYPLRLKSVPRKFPTHLNIKVSNSRYQTTYPAQFFLRTLYNFWLESKLFSIKKILSIILIQRLIISINNPVPGNHSQRVLSTGLAMDSFYQINWVYIYCRKCNQKGNKKDNIVRENRFEKNFISKCKYEILILKYTLIRGIRI